MAYIASCSPNGSQTDDGDDTTWDENWTPEKQVAIWRSAIGNIGQSGMAEDTEEDLVGSGYYITSIILNGIKIYAQAEKYQEFINDSNHFTDNTSYGDLIETDKVTENGHDYYIIGPFNMTYNGKYTPSPSCMTEEFWIDWNVENGTQYCIAFRDVVFGGITGLSVKLDLNNDGTYETEKPIIAFGDTKSNVNQTFSFYSAQEASASYGDKYVQGGLYFKGKYEFSSGKPTKSGYSEPNVQNIVLPDSGDDFYIKISADGIDGITNAKITGQYKWMDFNGEEGLVRLNGAGTAVTVDDVDPLEGSPYTADVTIAQKNIHIQDLIAIKATRIIRTINFGGEFSIRPSVMNLEGYVFNDIETGKECLADGVYNMTSGSSDKGLKNIKVSLYYADGTLVPQEDLNPAEGTDISFTINPTLTKDDGYYMFAGLDTSKSYQVEFEYDGQKYIPTDWNKEPVEPVPSDSPRSASLELGGVRNVLNNRFKEIKSSPKSYTTQNNCGFNLTGNSNITFTRLELMGYTLTYDEAEQKYKYVYDSNKQLIDGYLYEPDGTGNTTYSEGVITKAIKQHIGIGTNNPPKNYPTNEELLGIYSTIAGNDTRLKQEIQFIEDCKIVATTAEKTNNNIFVTNTYSMDPDGEFNEDEGIYEISNVNLGLCNRQVFDLHIWNDANVMEIKVNGQTESYNYATVFTNDPDINGDIYTRLTSANNGDKKYNIPSIRKIYKSDYRVTDYKDDPEDNIEITIKYRIEVHNESMSAVGVVTEIVDNYSTSMQYVDGSITASMNEERIENVSVGATIYSGTEESLTGYNKLYIHGLENTQIPSGQSIVIDMLFKVRRNRNDLYLNLNDKQNIAEINGFKSYYKKDTQLPNNVVISNTTTTAGLIDCDSLPGNLDNSHLQAERPELFIQDDTDFSHAFKFEISGDRVIRGTVWEDKREEVVGGSLIGNGIKEDDETRIKNIQVSLMEFDGTKYVQAQRLEKKAGNTDEMQWTPAVAYTDDNGEYVIHGFLPGEYIVQFEYGNSYATALTDGSDQNETIDAIRTDHAENYVLGYFSEGETKIIGSNKNSYNGQDYKSTIFQAGISDDFDVFDMEYSYNLDSENISDAIDLFGKTEDILPGANGRNEVNNYSKVQTNYIAEVLASPYYVPKYPLVDENGVEQYDALTNDQLFERYSGQKMVELVNKLIENTKMTAITPRINAYIEYADADVDGDYNTEYVLPNLDFGLVERPKAQLEIEKTVENVKVTLSDGTILFDNTNSSKNLAWDSNPDKELTISTKEADFNGNENTSSYKNQYLFRSNMLNALAGLETGTIQVIIDNELMYGSTIQILYDITVKNVGEVDYDSYQYYAKGVLPENAPKSTTSADQVICYIPNNLQFEMNNEYNLDAENHNIWGNISSNQLTGNTSIRTTSQVLTDEEIIQNIINGNDNTINREGDGVVPGLIDGDDLVRPNRPDDEQEEPVLVNNNLKYIVDTYNMILSTDDLKEDLEGNESKSTKLVVSKLISKSDDDDLDYESLVEIVKTTNTLGRRMSYSIVGNQNAKLAPAEVDASKGETVKVLPPTGISNVIYYTLILAVATILATGIILIKKKVLN